MLLCCGKNYKLNMSVERNIQQNSESKNKDDSKDTNGELGSKEMEKVEINSKVNEVKLDSETMTV